MHDYEFIREVVSRIEPNRKVMNVEPKDKDRLVRRVIDNKELPFIIEGGRDRLDRNVRVLVSKLRSIRSSIKVKVLVLRDSDSNDAVNTFDRLKRDVENFISNRNKFPQYKPSVECGQGINAGSFMSHDCVLRYRDGEVLFQFVLVIPSLEDFLRSYGLLVMSQAFMSPL
ncbi:hypothetical protein [Vulcanisaeta sp. JCM 16159]|uniref:hypothetical protein n=1 Tax=Vulcanisaeta sp. JCM 16159 TaxID=1295371 RepID=UPI0006D1789D|nr:hypothetical protein [Vulcanisaeta sp. JCM 16159]